MFMSVVYTQHERHLRRRALAAALSMALLGGVAAHAQSTSTAPAAIPGASKTEQPPKANEPKAKNLQEIVVTALKTAQPASKTPAALSVIGGEQLKTQGITSVTQIGDVAPGVIMGRDPFGVNINIRGVTTTDQTSKGEQGIGFYVDGVPIRRPLVMGLSFFDIDHVEVLRGPQGTLYGGATTGGVINVVTKKPEQQLDASADVEIGNFGTHRENAMVNIPVSSIFALRAAVNANDRDGYLRLNDGSKARNDEHDRSARIQGLFTFSDDTSLLLGVTGNRVTGVGYGTVPLDNVLDNGSGAAQRTGYGNPFGGRLDDYHRAFDTTFKTAFGDIALTYVGGVSNYSAHEQTSATADPADNPSPFGQAQYAWRNYRGHFKTYSNELRFSNRTPGTIDWVAGISYVDEDIHESDHNLNAPVSDPTIAASVNAIDPVNETTHKSGGVFGQVTWHFNEQWAASAGARYSSDRLKRVGTFAAGPSPGCADALQDCIGGPNNGSEKDTKATYRLGVQYFLTPQQMFYGSVATGYKPGGFNDFDPKTLSVAPYASEQLTAYELGYKGHPSDSLHFDSDIFYYDYARDQISSLTMVAGLPIVYTRSIPATIYGWENELTWQATRDDRLTASASFERARYDRFMTGLNTNVDWSGRSMDKTPHAVVKVGYSHEWAMASGAYVDLHLSSQYSSGYYVSDFVNAIQYRQKPFTRSEADLTYTSPSDRYWVQVFAKNIENEVQLTSVGGNYDAGISDPRYVGVRFGVRMR